MKLMKFMLATPPSPAEQLELIITMPVGFALVCSAWLMLGYCLWRVSECIFDRWVLPPPIEFAAEPSGADDQLDLVRDQLYDLRTCICLGRTDVARERVEQLLFDLEMPWEAAE